MSGNSGRTIAIGDIHGCVHALHAVLEAIQPTAEDQIVVLGDYIDQGRDTRDVIDVLIDLDRHCQLRTLLGNHEEMLLSAFDHDQAAETWLEIGGIATLNSYRFGATIDVIPDRHLEFIRRGLPYFETETHIFVHANYDPTRPMDQQPEYTLRWALLEETPPAPHVSGKTVVCGHTEQPRGKVLDLGHVICIDTACYRGGWLTALDVSTRHIWQADRWGLFAGS